MWAVPVTAERAPRTWPGSRAETRARLASGSLIPLETLASSPGFDVLFCKIEGVRADSFGS